MKKISDLTPEHIRSYFTARLPDARFKSDRAQQMVRCLWHTDYTASLSINLERGIWNCKAGCGEGGLIAFEAQFSACDRVTAAQNIFEILGIKQPKQDSMFARKPEAVYDYTDEAGRLLYQKLRYPGKRFMLRKPTEDGTWDYQLGDFRKVLYHLPEVVTANWVLLTEGEKDSDNVRNLNLGQHDKRGLTRLATTTNFDGAEKWRPEYSPYFTGKQVVILPDNDDPGRRHAKLVAKSVHPYAHSLRVVDLPDLGEHQDVSDYLIKHSAEELTACIKATPIWQPVKSPLLVSLREFMSGASVVIDWLVDGIIQRGANGFIVSAPKAGKSFQAANLALSLALGLPWTGFTVFQRAKVALISREDNPGLTRWRLGRLLLGLGKTQAEADEWLYVNSKDQSPQFKLDMPEQVTEMMTALRQLKPEFVILDVLNVMHGKDENDNTDMRLILDTAEMISREFRCSVCILHHFNKEKDGRLTEKMRGSSAIAGFAEWIIGIRMQSDRPDERVRIMEFDSKASAPHAPVKYTVNGEDDSAQGLRIERWVEEAPQKSKKVSGLG